VDDFYGLGRVDRWLNSRPPRQHAALHWFQAFMAGWLLGLTGWFAGAIFGTASLIALPPIALAAAILAVPLRRLLPALYARRLRRKPDRTGPEFTWPQLALTTLLSAEMPLEAVGQTLGPSLHHQVFGAALALLQGILAIAILPVAFMIARYSRRLAQAHRAHWPPLPYPPLPPQQLPSPETTPTGP